MRSVKIALKKVIGRCSLNYDELLTVLTEIKELLTPDQSLTFTMMKSQFRMRSHRHS